MYQQHESVQTQPHYAAHLLTFCHDLILMTMRMMLIYCHISMTETNVLLVLQTQQCAALSVLKLLVTNWFPAKSRQHIKITFQAQLSYKPSNLNSYNAL